MTYKTHATTSLVFGLFIFRLLGIPFTVISFLVIILGSLVPDLDHPQSYISRRSFGIGRIVSTFTKHRGFMHSLLACMILSFLPYYLFNYYYIPLAFFTGYLGHLLGDIVTPTGIPVFYPKKDHIRFPFTIKTGSGMEYVLLAFSLGFLAYSFGFY